MEDCCFVVDDFKYELRSKFLHHDVEAFSALYTSSSPELQDIMNASVATSDDDSFREAKYQLQRFAQHNACYQSPESAAATLFPRQLHYVHHNRASGNVLLFAARELGEEFIVSRLSDLFSDLFPGGVLTSLREFYRTLFPNDPQYRFLFRGTVLHIFHVTKLIKERLKIKMNLVAHKILQKN